MYERTGTSSSVWYAMITAIFHARCTRSVRFSEGHVRVHGLCMFIVMVFIAFFCVSEVQVRRTDARFIHVFRKSESHVCMAKSYSIICITFSCYLKRHHYFYKFGSGIVVSKQIHFQCMRWDAVNMRSGIMNASYIGYATINAILHARSTRFLRFFQKPRTCACSLHVIVIGNLLFCVS